MAASDFYPGREHGKMEAWAQGACRDAAQPDWRRACRFEIGAPPGSPFCESNPLKQESTTCPKHL